MSDPLYLSLAIGTLLLALGATILARPRRLLRGAEPLRHDPWPLVSVVIPARDEAHNLPALLATLDRQDSRYLEVIVVDDGSTDGTAELAAAAGAMVVSPPPAPQEFAGKTWACLSGALKARGELLLFLDADTRLEPGAVGSMVRAWQRLGGVITVEPYQEMSRPHEQLSSLFCLARTGGMGAFGLLSRSGRSPGAFGPCLLMDRREYLASGGHGQPEVRGQVLENVKLGRVLRQRGLPVHAFLGQGMLWTRSYPTGALELIRGWSKAIAQGAGASPEGLAGVITLVAAAHLSALLLAVSAGLAMGGLATPLALALALYLGMALVLLRQLRLLGRFSPLLALLFPIPLLFFDLVFALSVYQSSWRRRVSWKGRIASLGAVRRAS